MNNTATAIYREMPNEVFMEMVENMLNNVDPQYLYDNCITELELMQRDNVEAYHEWYKRLVDVVQPTVQLHRDDFMHNLYHYWHEYSLHWWKYPGCDDMVRDFADNMYGYLTAMMAEGDF